MVIESQLSANPQRAMCAYMTSLIENGCDGRRM